MENFQPSALEAFRKEKQETEKEEELPPPNPLLPKTLMPSEPAKAAYSIPFM